MEIVNSGYQFSDFGTTGADVLSVRGDIAHAIFTNNTGATVYFRVYSTTKANVTLASTTASFTIAVPSGTTEQIATFWPILMSNGCSVFATTFSTGSTAGATGHIATFMIN